MELSGFTTIMIFIGGAALFALSTLVVSRLLRPSRPNEEKLTTYESGEEPLGSAWGIFNIRFYVIAIVFLLFEVELVFLFPWAVIFADEQMLNDTNGLWGWFTLTEAFIFILVLAVGLLYVWKKGMLDWEKPAVQSPTTNSKVPENLYDQINQRYR